jgi:hypothetical protein
MTADALKDCNKKYLAQLAKDQGITGWHAMRKDQLIRALSAPRPASAKKAGSKSSAAARKNAPPATREPSSRGHGGDATVAAPPSVASPAAHKLDHAHQKDRIFVLARDSYWLHAYWELSRATLGRAEAALGQQWHTARPILRVIDVSAEDTTLTAERHIRDIPIHGAVNNWYIDVLEPPRSYRVDVGYLSRRGKFYVLARSNVVTTPKVGVADPLDEDWLDVQKQIDRLQSPASIGEGRDVRGESIDLQELFEERLRRPMNSLSLQAPRENPSSPSSGRGFHFRVDTELIVYGATEPGAQVTLQGEAVDLRRDGTFTIRFSLPDSRQVIPAIATSADGTEERTIIIAVGRDSRELEPVVAEGAELMAEQEAEPSWAARTSRAQLATPERSPGGRFTGRLQREEESHTITEFAISDTKYVLQKPCRTSSRTDPNGHTEYLVAGFEPLFVGRGVNARLAEADWIEQVHVAFQLLYRKMPFEMTPNQAAQWSVLERSVDVDAYTRQTPVVFRQLGKVSKIRHAPCEVIWIDGSTEEVSLAVAPGEFAGFTLGQWFEALVERDPGTWQVRRILNIVPTEPADSMPPERLERFWNSLPTTSALPRSPRDWTAK